MIIPPDFNLLPPEQLQQKNIDSVEGDLAKEILFGLDKENQRDDIVLSTMENIIDQTDADLIDDSIREEINEDFASEKNVKSKIWNDEVEILDSIAESQRLRNKLLDNSSLEDEIPKVKIKVKNKKKKRFFFF